MRAWTAFERVLAAEAVSNLGSMLSRLAIPWFATLSLGATPLQMGALLVADVAAGAVGALWLGGWVDRQPARRVMLLADGLRAALLLGLAMLAALGALGWWALVAAAALNGLAGTGFALARTAWIARASGPEALAGRNAALSASGSIAEALAFALGGWLYQAAGAVVALLVDGLSYLASACCLRGVPEAAATAAPSRGPAWRRLVQDVRAGAAAVWQHPTLRTLSAIEALLALAMSVTGTSYMIYVSRDLALAPGPLGMVFALGGLGALAGAAAAPTLGRRLGPGRALALGLLVMALGAACIPLASGAPWFALLMLALHQVIGDAGATLRDVHDVTWRQTAAPPDRLARVDGTLRGLGQALTLVGAIGGGAVATAWGARAALVGSAGLVGLAALVAFLALVRWPVAQPAAGG
jgi:predicted MFS family arabinose efflux permease